MSSLAKTLSDFGPLHPDITPDGRELFAKAVEWALAHPGPVLLARLETFYKEHLSPETRPNQFRLRLAATREEMLQFFRIIQHLQDWFKEHDKEFLTTPQKYRYEWTLYDWRDVSRGGYWRVIVLGK